MPRSHLIASRVSAAAACTTAAIGAIVFTGWAADADAMRRLFFGRIHMLPNTAVAFVLAGASLWLQHRPEATAGRQGRRLLAHLLAGVVLAVGAVTFAERLFDWDAGGIDRLLFPELLARQPYRPLGRMATNSAFAFTLAGAALLSLDVVTARRRRPAQWLATTGLAIAAMAIIGYLYGARVLYGIDAAAGMAISTALAFFAIHLGILFARPEGGGALLLLSDDAGGMLARRLVVAVALVPLVLGRLWIAAREGSLVSREVGVAIFVVAVIAILLAVALHAATVVRAGDRARQATLEREAAARAEAERANRAKNDFLAVMSHELRTPLNAVIGYGSLLADGISGPVTEPQRHHLGRIAASARHLLALIDEVLTLSRLEAGEEHVVPEPVAVATVVEEAAAMVQPQAQAKGLRFHVSLPDAALIVETDVGKLRQALVNLLGNAVKFTERGGVRLRVTTAAEGDVVVFDVEDSGVGIEPAHLDRVFESFWQADQALSRRVGGVGLGLHVTRRLVGLLGGEVSVRSTPGEGSCFTIRLPRQWWGTATGAFPARARNMTPVPGDGRQAGHAAIS